MGLLDQTTEVVDDKPTIELSFFPKDSQGRPLGTRKTIRGDGFKIWRGWLNGNGPGNKHKKKKKKTNNQKKTRYKEVLPKGQEAEKLAKEAATYAENKQAKREQEATTTNEQNV